MTAWVGAVVNYASPTSADQIAMNELCYLSIAEASRLIATRKISPLELTQAHLDRIYKLDGHLLSLITLTSEIALTDARRATEEVLHGRLLRPLHGIPVTYKDTLATAGVRTTAASRVYEHWVPDKDSNVVARMRQARSVLLGKANLSEFSFAGGSGDQDFMKPPRNPWNADYSSGGSSNGSAVGVAAGLAMASVGADSGGSIRIPAAHCGVVGFKPTYGLIGRSGEIPLSYSVGHLGPLTRSVEDAAILLECLAGFDPQDRASIRTQVPPYWKLLSSKPAGLRLGLCSSYMDAVGMHSEVASFFEDAVNVFRSLGFPIHEVSVPHLNYACAASYNNIMRIEAFCTHFQNFRDPAIRSKYGHAFRNIARGGFLTTLDYFRAQQARALISAELATAFQDIDVLLTPTTPSPPSPITVAIAEKQTSDRLGTDPKVNRTNFMHEAAYTSPFNLTGNPVLSVPSGFTSRGLPVGMQLIARPLQEASLLSLGHQYQLATDWHRRRPPLR